MLFMMFDNRSNGLVRIKYQSVVKEKKTVRSRTDKGELKRKIRLKA